MKRTIPLLPAAGSALFAVFLLAVAFEGGGLVTMALVAGGLLVFVLAWASASHLLGTGAALRFVAVALALGWFAEQMGASYGWFIGSRQYADALGWRLGAVPAVLPLMWFTLCYAGYVIANLMIWHAPVDGSPRWGDTLLLSLLAAMVVTTFDVGAYRLFEPATGVMAEADGGWTNATGPGRIGGLLVAFAIVLAFRLAARGHQLPRSARLSPRHVLLPLALYGAALLFQLCLGEPAQSRGAAVLAMGIPLLAALTGWRQWRRYTAGPPARAGA